MSKISFFLFIIACITICCNDQKNNDFNLQGTVSGDYTGKLFLYYEDKIDSVLIENGTYNFNGKVDYPIEAYFSTSSISTCDKVFYLENTNIIVDISIEKKKIKEYTIDWISIDTIIGTNTSKIVYDFEQYEKLFSDGADWNIKLYNKANEIIKNNPRHRYSGYLLNEIIFDSVLDYGQLKNLYKGLNLKFQDSFTIRQLKYNIFPEDRVKVGDTLNDFKLFNLKDEEIDTKKYRGSLLLIDFWASWCKPCIKEFPVLLEINQEFDENNFKVLGVSIDEDKEKWIKALEQNKLIWENVIDGNSDRGKVANEFGIFTIPSNLLIDEKGKIIAKDISMENLKIKLYEIYNLD